MKEEYWLSSDQAGVLLGSLGTRASRRSLLLFACAACRVLEPLLRAPGFAGVLALAEGKADGAVDRAAVTACWNSNAPKMRHAVERSLYLCLQDALLGESTVRTASNLQMAIGVGCLLRGEEAGHLLATLVRDIFGNPFRPVRFDPSWRTPDVESLARAAYEIRELPSGRLDPMRMTILADALEDAGCGCDRLLGHLRDESPHVRGCWALDLLLANG